MTRHSSAPVPACSAYTSWASGAAPLLALARYTTPGAAVTECTWPPLVWKLHSLVPATRAAAVADVLAIVGAPAPFPAGGPPRVRNQAVRPAPAAATPAPARTTCRLLTPGDRPAGGEADGAAGLPACPEPGGVRPGPGAASAPVTVRPASSRARSGPSPAAASGLSLS